MRGISCGTGVGSSAEGVSGSSGVSCGLWGSAGRISVSGVSSTGGAVSSWAAAEIPVGAPMG